MDKVLLNEMLDLAKREKTRAEKMIRELNQELRLDGSKPPRATKKKGQQTNSKRARAKKEICRVLNSVDEYLGPSKIVEQGKELGIELESNLVRSVLSRGKDSAFVSPERGKWTTKEKAKELEQAKENATA